MMPLHASQAIKKIKNKICNLEGKRGRWLRFLYFFGVPLDRGISLPENG